MKKNIKAILLILFISLFTEVFIFNIKTITSINFKQISVKSKIILGSDIIDSNGIYVVKNTKNAYIEIKNINKNIHNLFIDLDFIKNSGKYLEYDIYASDSGSKLYYKLPSRYLYNNIERSKYVDLNLSGKVNKLKIVFKNNNFKFKINNIAINKSRPIDISWTRLIITFTLLLVIYYIRPNSELYKYTFNLNSKKQKIIIVLYLIIQFIFFFYIVNINKYVKNPGLYSQHYQYQDLAHSLSRGKLYLEIPVDKNLKNMKNPYDTKYRAKLSNEKGLSFYPDRAFYEGKYYVYF